MFVEGDFTSPPFIPNYRDRLGVRNQSIQPPQTPKGALRRSIS